GLVLTRLDRTDDPRLQPADDFVLLQHRKIEQHRDAIAKEGNDAVFPRSERERSGGQDIGLLEAGRLDAIAEQDRAGFGTYSERGGFVGHGLRQFNNTGHKLRPMRDPLPKSLATRRLIDILDFFGFVLRITTYDC